MKFSIANAIFEAAQVLRNGGVSDARKAAGSLLSYVTGRDRTFLISHADELLSESDLTDFREYVERRARGEPLQYIIGTQDFYGLEFKVTPDVLIPRPETELLVETALKLLGGHDTNPMVCDVGTGSGCIVVSLLHSRPLARAYALDISEGAIGIARENATRHGVDDRITFVVSDCFQALVGSKQLFDAIVSNPPYVAVQTLEWLQREVRDHEPQVALSDGADGLSIIRRLLLEAPDFLRSEGYLILEIGFDQGEAVAQLIDSSVWKLLDVLPDLQNIPRIVALQKIGS